MAASGCRSPPPCVFYNGDRDGPIAFEPSGEDFLSPCLAEADLMRRVCTPPELAEWLTAFLPEMPTMRPVSSPDPERRKIGPLRRPESSSRAWMLFGIAKGLPDDDPRRLRLLFIADAHRDHGVAALTGGRGAALNYAGSHLAGNFRGVPGNNGPGGAPERRAPGSLPECLMARTLFALLFSVTLVLSAQNPAAYWKGPDRARLRRDAQSLRGSISPRALVGLYSSGNWS